MTCEFESPIIQKLDEHLSGDACFVVSVFRDETDSYAITIDNRSEFANDAISIADLIPILPTGSSWAQALGWHSYIGIPFQTKSERWIAIGAEEIHKHASRGAFPIYKAYIFPFDMAPTVVSKRLERLATSISSSTMPFLYYGIIKEVVAKGRGINPDDHAKLEACIIRKASEYYRKSRALLFRSLILSEQTVLNIKHQSRSTRQSSQSRLNHEYFLMATVPSIERTFSARTQRLLKLAECIECRCVFFL
jgi:hypothetical protein